MNTLTIPVRQVQKGDLIDFGGQPIPVLAVDVEGNLTTLWLPDGQLNRCDISFQYDAKITVHRADPDPEVELVDVTAAAIYEATHPGRKWMNANQHEWRPDARMVLDAIRSAGYQVVKASCLPG